MHSEKSNYIIGGDINLNLLKYQIDTHITDYVNSILSFGCISLLNKLTRFSSTHQPSLLDHISTNIIDDNTTTGIAPYDISDQLPIFANFNFHPKCAKKYRPKICCLKLSITLIESFPNLCTFPPTSADEIRQIIASLKCKTTSNYYDIPAKFLKISASSLSSWLSEFFNKCMTKGEFPHLLKIALITPIPKITSPKSSNDYRPISILPTLSKVFEKVIYSRLYSFVTSNCILSPQQYCLRTNHSTELAIAAIYDDIIYNEDNKLITCNIT